MNDGDAEDAFDTRTTIGATTLPSTASFDPSPERIAPAFTIGAPDGEGRQSVDVALFRRSMVAAPGGALSPSWARTGAAI